MPMTVVRTMVPPARYRELPSAERKLPCSTLWKFPSVRARRPRCQLPWVLKAATTSQTKGTEEDDPHDRHGDRGPQSPCLSLRRCRGPLPHFG